MDSEKIGCLAKLHGCSLNALLRKAGVSKTAYYSLLARASLLPKTVTALAEALSVQPHQLLSWEPAEVAMYRARESRLRQMLKRYPRADRDNVWHTLVLLELRPLQRLEGALRRAR